MHNRGSVRYLGLIGLGLFLGLVATLLSAADAEYVGQAKCKACHMEQYKVWEASPHAKALDKLTGADRENAECLACHTTGHGGAAAASADLPGVQCEACHGPGSAYKSMKIMSKTRYKDDPDGAHKEAVAAGLLVPDEKTCTRCHNEKSPTFKGFDYAKAREAIKHWE